MSDCRNLSKLNRQVIHLHLITLAILFLCSCAAENRSDAIPPALDETGRQNPEPAIAELQRLYQAATSEHERRAICLRAIDEGKIYRGGPVLNIDQIFGTNFASKLPKEREMAPGLILFATQPKATPSARGYIEAVPYVGWYLSLDYDHDGRVQYYFFSNLHKGLSRRIDGQQPISTASLKQLYDAARSELERRDIALRAIDEGVIQTFGPVNVSTVDAVFGTHLAAKLPTKKERTTTAFIDLTAAPGTESRTTPGWFLAISYFNNGSIEDYYVTNIRK